MILIKYRLFVINQSSKPYVDSDDESESDDDDIPPPLTPVKQALPTLPSTPTKEQVLNQLRASSRLPDLIPNRDDAQLFSSYIIRDVPASSAIVDAQGIVLAKAAVPLGVYCCGIVCCDDINIFISTIAGTFTLCV